jgi:Ca-activated chloride channel family protein
MAHLVFARPLFVVAALLCPLAAAAGRRFVREAFYLSLSLGPPDGERFRAPRRSRFAARAAFFLEIAGVMALLIAAGGPERISGTAINLDRGADMLFVLDASPSMACLDIGGRRRFDAARSLVRDFALRRPADAIGLVALGSDAALLVPPTTDRNALLSRLDDLRIGELGDGTALGMGLSVAALH